MEDFVVQVFRGDWLVDHKIVWADSREGARQKVQEEYPDLVISVHSLELYREIISSIER